MTRALFINRSSNLILNVTFKVLNFRAIYGLSIVLNCVILRSVELV